MSNSSSSDSSQYSITFTDNTGNSVPFKWEITTAGNTSIDDFPIYRWEAYETLPDMQKTRLKELLEELANTPILKIPFWIETHKKELEELGVTIKETKIK